MRISAQSGFSYLYILIVVCGLLALGGLGFYFVIAKQTCPSGIPRCLQLGKIDKYIDIENRDLKYLSTPQPTSTEKVINPKEEDVPIYYRP